METEILRRRAAGERIVSIATDYGVAHQTISKLTKRHALNRAAELEPATEVAPSVPSEQQSRCRSEPSTPLVRHRLLPTVFANWDERLAYYEHHSLESQADWLNYRDALSGRETPAERRARLAGNVLSLR